MMTNDLVVRLPTHQLTILDQIGKLFPFNDKARIEHFPMPAGEILEFLLDVEQFRKYGIQIVESRLSFRSQNIFFHSYILVR